MNYELIFEAPKGQRLMSRYSSITIMDYGENGWWIHDERRWGELCGKSASKHAPRKSVKAFKRHLRKHEKTLAGREIVLYGRFVGHTVIVKWKSEND